MDRILDRLGNGYKLCILRYQNVWIGVPEDIDNCRRGLEFCAERDLCVGSTCFEQRNLRKCTRVEKGQDGLEIKS